MPYELPCVTCIRRKGPPHDLKVLGCPQACTEGPALALPGRGCMRVPVTQPRPSIITPQARRAAMQKHA